MDMGVGVAVLVPGAFVDSWSGMTLGARPKDSELPVGGFRCTKHCQG